MSEGETFTLSHNNRTLQRENTEKSVAGSYLMSHISSTLTMQKFSQAGKKKADI